jgi:hypothetical protein
MICLSAPLLAGALLATGGCASGHQPQSAPTVASATATNQLGPGLLEWDGRFQAIQQQTGDGTSVRAHNNANGTVKLTAAGMGRTTAELNIFTPLTTATDVRWAMASGACGSGALPLLPVDEFPEIQVSSNGHGSLTSDVSVPMPTAGSFHVNIYWGDGRDESDVMTCANLRVQPRR